MITTPLGEGSLGAYLAAASPQGPAPITATELTSNDLSSSNAGDMLDAVLAGVACR